MEFQLKADFIELDNLLKMAKLAANGAHAREQIQSAQVKVNGKVESRIRRKLRLGDIIELNTEQIKIVKTE